MILKLHARTPVTMDRHPVLDHRSAGSGFQILLCHPGILRGHPLRRLVPINSMCRPRLLVAPLPILLHAPIYQLASSVVSRATTSVSVPRTTPASSESLLAVVSQQQKCLSPSQPPLLVAMSTTSQLKRLKRTPTSFSVRSLLIAIRQLFSLILEHLIHLFLRAMLDCTILPFVTCPPPW